MIEDTSGVVVINVRPEKKVRKLVRRIFVAQLSLQNYESASYKFWRFMYFYKSAIT